MPSSCSITGCDRKHLARGYCGAHYYRWREYGDPQAERPVTSLRTACTVDGCSRKHLANGYCSLHYQRIRHHGDPEWAPQDGCDVAGCPHPHKANGLCNAHYARQLRARPGARKAETDRAYYRAHNLSPEEWQALWDKQQGRCILCGDPMRARKGKDWLAAVIDHDHSCCSGGKSCESCRRGLAHSRCNRIAGLAGDDPDLLRRIAGGLTW